MSNAAPSDNVVLRQAVEQIQRCLPGHWSTSVSVKTNDAAHARLTIKTPAGASAALAIGARRQLDPRFVPEVADALKATAADGFVVIAPFLGARTRERLAGEGLGYVDLVGNMRVVLDRPTVFIQTSGEARSPWATGRAARSLHGAKACRLVRALAERGAGASAGGGGPSSAAPFGVRALAARAGTDPGYVSRLLDLFDREELVDRDERGVVTAVHVERLLRRWAEDYRFTEAHRAVPCVHPHGVPGALAALQSCGAPYALTARTGAAALLGTALPALVTAYVDNAERVAHLVGATAAGPAAEAQAGTVAPNLLLVEPFDPFPLDGKWERAGLAYAAPMQIVADLLGSPAPAPDQATAILRRAPSQPLNA